MEYFDEKIEKTLDMLRVKKKRDANGNSYYSTTEGKIYDRRELFQMIRIILGIDKQCSQCNDWKFDSDLSLIDDTNKLICEMCAHKILSGEQKVID